MTIHRRLPKLDLNVTNRCNFRCAHCAFDSGIMKMDELSMDEIRTLLEDTRELGGERIDITGGEPTVREDVGEIISLGKSLGYRIELVTNGSLTTREKLSYYKKLGLDSIAISLDGSSYDVYSRIRKTDEGTYRRVLESIDAAAELGLYTKVNTVAFTSNLGDLPAITEYCIQRGADEHGIYYFTPVGRGSRTGEQSIEPKAWLKFIRENLVKYSERIKLSIEVPTIEKGYEGKNLGCILTDDPFHMQILPNGDVYPCAILASYQRPIANLHDKSIKKIWNDEKLWKDYYQKIDSNIFCQYGGSCVDFGGFDLRDYTDYKFVCPLRKFMVGDLK